MEKPYTIIIGNKSYSSWSLRAWLGIRYVCGCDGFSEVMCYLAGAGAYNSKVVEEIKKYSPSAKVPALYNKELNVTIHDSLAILLHIADRFPDSNLLPNDPVAKALCLSLSAEMHSGFQAVRNNLPHNCVVTARVHGEKVLKTIEVQRDIERLNEIFNDTRLKFENKGPFLFGTFSIADCMFAPVAIRFKSYDPELNSLNSLLSKEYISTLYGLDIVQEWIESAKLEGLETKIKHYEEFADNYDSSLFVAV
jgi:glutathione S-transferase